MTDNQGQLERKVGSRDHWINVTVVRHQSVTNSISRVITVTVVARFADQANVQGIWDVFFGLSCLLLGVCPGLHKIAQPGLFTSTLVLQNCLVDSGCDFFTKCRVQERRKRRGQFITGENQKCKGPLQIGQELRVCGSAWCKLCRGKIKGRSNIATGGVHAGADQLNQLQTQEGEMQRGIFVKDLLKSC